MWMSVLTTMVVASKCVSTPWGATNVSAQTDSSSVTTNTPASTAQKVRLPIHPSIHPSPFAYFFLSHGGAEAKFKYVWVRAGYTLDSPPVQQRATYRDNCIRT